MRAFWFVAFAVWFRKPRNRHLDGLAIVGLFDFYRWNAAAGSGPIPSGREFFGGGEYTDYVGLLVLLKPP